MPAESSLETGFRRAFCTHLFTVCSVMRSSLTNLESGSPNSIGAGANGVNLIKNIFGEDSIQGFLVSEEVHGLLDSIDRFLNEMCSKVLKLWK